MKYGLKIETDLGCNCTLHVVCISREVDLKGNRVYIKQSKSKF